MRTKVPPSPSYEYVPTIQKMLQPRTEFQQTENCFLSPCHHTSQPASISQSYTVPFHQGHVHSCIYNEFHTTEFTVSEYVLQVWVYWLSGAFTCIQINYWHNKQQAPMLPKLQIMNINYINTYLTLACKWSRTNVSNENDNCASIFIKNTEFYYTWAKRG